MRGDAAMNHWIPQCFLQTAPESLQCQWLYLDHKRSEEPFFDETIGNCLAHPYNSSFYKVITSIEDMTALAAQVESIAPSAFIFHTSRCGSTLMTQLLSLWPTNIVVPEHAALDQLLRWPLSKEEQQNREAWFKACVRLLGQKRFAGEDKFIIKLDCWHFAFFEQIASWYPDTPKIILYREPKGSIASHLKHPGMQAVPYLLEPELFDLDETPSYDTLAYLNQVFTAMYRQIQKIVLTHPDVLLLDYASGVEEMFRQISNTLQLQLDATGIRGIKERLAYHSKRGTEKYQEQNALDVAVSLACQDAYSHLHLKTYC